MPKRRTLEEQKAMYGLYKQSGLSIREFCQLNNISTKSIWRWGKEFEPDTANANADKVISATTQTRNGKNVNFYPIGKIKDKSREDSYLEISLPSGLSCRAYLSKEDISILVRELFK